MHLTWRMSKRCKGVGGRGAGLGTEAVTVGMRQRAAAKGKGGLGGTMRGNRRPKL